ncbi:uncharacterized protein BN621_01872 [Clostridium sp. CAG:352]|nr:uncharacterized protein BN621_01872 [Clostridium sp. CAG:352]
MFCKKGFCKVHKVRDGTVFFIRPITCKFKAIRSLFLFCCVFFCIIFDMLKSCCIRIILCVCTIGDYKQLYILIQSAACPKAVTLVSIDLVKRFSNCVSSFFKLNMHQWQSVYQNRHIITSIMLSAIFFILVYYLQMIVMNVGFVDQFDVFYISVIKGNVLQILFLYFAGFLYNSIITV